MIKLERINGKTLYLNLFQIEMIEFIPETKIKMMNGDFFLVKDSAEDINRQVKELIGGGFLEKIKRD